MNEKSIEIVSNKESSVKSVTKASSFLPSIDMFSATTLADLSKDKREELAYKIENAKIDLQVESCKRAMRSQMARSEIETLLEDVSPGNGKSKPQIDHRELTGETGSGNYKVVVKNDNPTYVFSIICAIGILCILAILAFKACSNSTF